MNRRILIVALIALLLLATGCRKSEVTPTEPSVAATTEPIETLGPGVGIVEEGVIMEDEADEATEPAETIPAETEPKATEPESEKETTPKATEPEKETDPTEKPGDSETTPAETTPPAETKPSGGSATVSSAYSDYMSMSAAQQQAFIESFESMDAFMAWFNQAKAEHNANDNSIEVGNGTIDLEQITGGN